MALGLLPVQRASAQFPGTSFTSVRGKVPTIETELLIMGSFVSQPLEPVKDVAPPEVASSANPVPVIAPGGPAPPAEAPLFNNCWSCRVLSGSGLIGAGGYVYWVARKPMKLGYPPGPGTIAQMVFGISESLGHYPWAGGRGRRGAQPRGRGRGARVGHVAAGIYPPPLRWG